MFSDLKLCDYESYSHSFKKNAIYILTPALLINVLVRYGLLTLLFITDKWRLNEEQSLFWK